VSEGYTLRFESGEERAVVQELATGLNYRNLRRSLEAQGGDPALSRLLGLLSVSDWVNRA
jgi:hypothetical protein